MTIATFPATAFVDNTTVVSAEALNHFRTNLPKCVDGSAGGTYTPSAVIEINGSGIKSDNIGNSTVTGTLTCQGTVTCQAAVTVDASLSLTGGRFSKDSTVRAPLRVDDSSLGDSNVTIHTSALSDVYVMTTSVTASRTWSLDVTGAEEDGEVVLIKLPGTPAFDILVHSVGGAANPIATFKTTPTTGVDNTHQWARFWFDDTAAEWKLLDAHPSVAA